VPNYSNKIYSRDALRRQVEQWRRSGDKIVLTNGCFDVLHVGHVRYLSAAKAIEPQARVVVAINSDDSARRLKGIGRPRVPQDERAELVAALGSVDAVIIFQEPDVRSLIRELRPDIHAKGTDYTRDSVPERDVVNECGGRVEIVGDPKQHSSTQLLERWKKS
jgi:rfaE bifunctional protein nucleotidyltransferase chain/domain